MNHFKFATVCVAFSCLAIGCNSNPAEKTETADKATEAAQPIETKPDLAKIKADIQALENAWATADNARDANALVAFYSDDAVSMANNTPMLVGKAAIQKDIEMSLAKRASGSTTSYEIMDVFGDENTVTEVGKIIRKDSTGKMIYTGKYMAI